MFILLLLGAVLALAIIWWYILYFKYFHGIWGIPIPITLPIVGNLYQIRHVDDAYWLLHSNTMKIGKGKAVRGSVGYIFGISIADPEFLEHVMTHTSTINKSSLYRFGFNWLGRGLLSSEAEKWRIRRKLLSPAYHFAILEQFIDVFDKNSTILVQKLQTVVGQQRTDIFPFISLCALDIICETAMGTSVNAQIKEDSEYVHATKEINRIFMRRALSLFKQFDLTYRFTRDYYREKQCLNILHGYTLSVINSRREELLNTKISKEENIGCGYKQKIPFLDLLLQASLNGEPLSDEDIREEVDTFMFEGHDTVSSAISFCIFIAFQKIQMYKNN